MQAGTQGGDVVMGNLEDCRTELCMHENSVGEVGLQEGPIDEVRLKENHGFGFKRMKRDEEVSVPLQEIQISSTNLRSMADEGGDMICSEKESTRKTEAGQGGVRKPVKRKLYSETGDGPKILE